MRGFGEILALGEHPPRERTPRVVLGAAQERSPPAERVRWLGVGASNLPKRHPGPFTNRGLFERRHPDAPRHCFEAYRTTASGKAGGG